MTDAQTDKNSIAQTHAHMSSVKVLSVQQSVHHEEGGCAVATVQRAFCGLN